MSELFENKLKELDLTLTEEQRQQFLTFYELLVERNKVMNLTSITEYEEVNEKHFVDSLSIVKIIDMQKITSIMDIGTGAGFPGIPLKIMYPHLKITLLDSLNKRVKFLDEIIQELNLSDMETLHGRAEDFAQNKGYRESFDLCVSRAVANLSTLAEYCIPYIRVGGIFISYKSGQIEEEVEQSKNAIKSLGGHLKEIVKFELPQTDIKRSFIKIEKVAGTSKKYPRKAGLPSKEPL